MRSFHACLPVFFLVPSLLGGCAEPTDAELTDEQSAALASDDELSFLRRAHATYVAGATDAQFAPLRDVGTGENRFTLKSSYYRTTCSLALAGAVIARKDGVAPSPMVTTWIREAIREYAELGRDAWGHHVKLAPAVDCMLAASVAKPFLARADLDALRSAVIGVASAVYAGEPGKSRIAPADLRKVGRALPGNTQAEEAALGADFFYLASRLAVPQGDARGAAWRERADLLFRYAGMLPARGATYDGEPFRRSGKNDRPLGADETVVTNHGLEVSPYYSLGALLSYADAFAVARATNEPLGLPPGITKDRRAISDGVRTGEQLGVRDVVAGGLRFVDRSTFGFTGAYRWVGEDLSGDQRLDYATQSHTIPRHPPGWPLLIPTTGTGRGAPAGSGTVSQFFDPLTASVKGYQINGGEIRAFECANEPRGWTCRARYRSALSTLFASLDHRERFGGHAIPGSNVNAMPQWFDAAGTLHTEVFSGGRVWRYTCAGATAASRRCAAAESVDLATHYARFGFTPSTMPPASGVDAASAFIHVDGTGRRYWTKGNRIWRARCDASFRGCTATSDTLAGQFASLSFSPALPTDAIDALTQIVQNGVLSTYVFKGDRVWKYDCTATSCAPRFTQTTFDQWRAITNQELWAYGTTAILKGVTDWGVQATMMNSAFALANVLGVDDGAYAQLLTRQRGAALGLGARTLLPSFFDDASGAFGYGAFRGAKSAAVHGPLHTLQDGWERRFFTPAERLNSYTWMNAFAARNHAVAYMLASGQRYVAPLF
ncbi:MAG: hypothetical protein KF819_09505 [Labilithrix sp.]|nr:hypothetical protein [Labilithrix sp.]